MQTVAKQSPLARVPLSRILIPFIVGIIASRFCNSIYLPLVIMAVGILFYISLQLLPHTPQWSMRTRPWWIIPIAIVSLSLGWINAIVTSPPILDTRTLDGAIAQARVNDINFRDNSMVIDATLTSASANNKQLIGRQYDIQLSTRGCNYNLQPGDMVVFECQLDTIKSLGNPDGFDYASYMLSQGIRYSEHLPCEKLSVYGHDPTLITRCNNYRRQLQKEVFSTSLSEKAQNFVVATLLGNSRFITPETRSLFSSAGISHVLALSGLHVSIILLAVWFVLFPLDHLRLRKLRLVITIAVMALYALFTGMSPSVVRATVMMTMVLIGMIFYRKSVTLNALAASALIILTISPMALFGVGFQLSFITVAAFMLVFKQNTSPGESRKKKNKIMQYVLQLTASSLVAMLSTIMLTAWYFGSMSFMSALSNLLVLPLFPLIMAFSMIFTVMCACSVQLDWFNTVIDTLYNYIEWIAKLTGEHLPGSFDSIYITGVEVFIYYLMLVFTLLWYNKKKFVWLNFAGLALAIMISYSAFIRSTTPQNGLIVFNNYSQTQVLAYNGDKATMWVPDGTPDLQSFKQSNKKFLAHYGIDSIETISGKEHNALNGMRIVCATDGRWKQATPPKKKIKTDLLIITKKYNGTIDQLGKIYDAEQIILSGDIYKGNLATLENECKQLGIRYYSIAKNGAWIASEE